MSSRYFLLPLLLLAGYLGGQTDFSSTLPIIVIDTEGREIPDEPKIPARMGVIDNGAGQLNRPDDAFNEYDGFVGIELRGSSSQGFAKKGYGLETRTADGEDRQVPLLGFPIEEDWVLHGPYSDKSLIRSALAYHLAGGIMDYAPRVRMTEVIINGDYRGVYLFTESIKRDRNRVDVKKMKPGFAAGDSLTGGYILKFDKFTGENFDAPVLFESAYNADTESTQAIRFIYHYPKPKDITPTQRSYLQNHISRFEDALAGDDFLDPVNGYRPYVDLPSFVDFLLINELSRNVDGYRLSSYFSKERDGKGGRLRMGPVWDFNLAFGNADYCDGGRTSGWAYDFGEVCPDDFFQLPFWWDRLQEDPAFVAMLNDRWDELRAGPWSTENLHATIDSFTVAMGEATARNFERWPVLNQYVWPNNFVGGTYTAEIGYLKGWVNSRAKWLDTAINQLTPVRYTGAQAKLLVSPNPTNGEIRLLSGIHGALSDVRVYNGLGRLLFTDRRLEQGVTIDLSSFGTGIYVLRARRGDGTVVTARVVVR